MTIIDEPDLSELDFEPAPPKVIFAVEGTVSPSNYGDPMREPGANPSFGGLAGQWPPDDHGTDLWAGWEPTLVFRQEWFEPIPYPDGSPGARHVPGLFDAAAFGLPPDCCSPSRGSLIAEYTCSGE